MDQNMENNPIKCKFYFDDLQTNRKKLFQEALQNAKTGKVLYIMCEELDELPQLSQELNSMNRHYMKMISFLYSKSLESLIDSLSTLPDWQNIPSTIILDDISTYCNNLHTACGLVALLIDSARSCSKALKEPYSLYISATKEVVDKEYCYILMELYST